MIEKRMSTWEQDLERLYEILKDAHTPAAMLNLKVKDMQKGTFVGKAKCGPRVRDLARRHRLDKGAATKLEEAMSMREAMGKDVEKDIVLLAPLSFLLPKTCLFSAAMSFRTVASSISCSDLPSEDANRLLKSASV
mmetsp:Transcript_11459/g.12650  ORF Transcript_11459/g.12650 Transcript_11459/m.12650 type:complete len:136 (+) Transcript_11459:3-410(+)